MLCEHSIVMNQKIRDESTNHYKNPLPHPEFIVRRCGSGFFYSLFKYPADQAIPF